MTIALKKLVFLSFFLFCFSSYSQTTTTDSLENLVKYSNNDTFKIRIFNLLCWNLKTTKPDKAFIYGQNALKLGIKHGSVNSVANSLKNIGVIFLLQGNYSKSLKYSYYALSIYEKTKNKEGIAKTLNNIGLIFFYMKNYDESLKYYFQSLTIRQNVNDESNAAAILNIGLIYFTKGDIKKSISYNIWALQVFRKIKSDQGIFNALNNIGMAYLNTNENQKARKYFQEALEIRKDIDDKKGIAMSLINIGETYKNLNKFDIAANYFNNSLLLAKEINDNAIIRENYKDLSETFVALNDYKKALEYHKLYAIVNDSIYNDENSRQISEMQTKYETAKKETEIELLIKDNEYQNIKIKRNRILLYSLAGGLFFILCIAFIIFYALRQKHKNNKILQVKNMVIEKQRKELADEKTKSDNILLSILPDEAIEEIKKNGKVTSEHYHKLTELFTNLQSEKLHSQFEALKSQVNPHFLFNSLNVLSSLVHIDSDLSEKFIDKLAKSYRYVLEQKDNELVLLKTEIEFLHSFAFLMKIRFEDKILWKINVDETKQQFFIPPLTLQILVENAIKHNIISKDSPLIIEIFNDEEDNLFIRNNYQPHENGTNSTGIGFKNIMNRYIFFTKKPVEYGVKNEYFVVKIPLINLISKNLTL